MTNLEKYNDAFITGLQLGEEELSNASTQTIERWDSIGHMSLIAMLEEAFGIEIDPDDMPLINSYEEGKKIMAKYGIDF